MIKHIVMWKLAEENKKENLDKMKKVLEDLKDKIEEIVEIEAGIDINGSEAAYDITLYSSFKSEEDLDTYQKHPDHLKAAEFVKKVAIDRAVVDYEV
ncbi:Dabb family protein [Natronospora cellulosivora (SeqCode)]